MNNDRYKVAVSSDLGELIPGYMKNQRKDLEALRAALAAADFEKLRQLGHRMKGTGDSYGFSKVTILGNQIENSARSGDRAGLEALIGDYAEYLANVQVVYK